MGGKCLTKVSTFCINDDDEKIYKTFATIGNNNGAVHLSISLRDSWPQKSNKILSECHSSAILGEKAKCVQTLGLYLNTIVLFCLRSYGKNEFMYSCHCSLHFNAFPVPSQYPFTHRKSQFKMLTCFVGCLNFKAHLLG